MLLRCSVQRVLRCPELRAFGVLRNRYNHLDMSESNPRLDRVLEQLKLYEHPWFTFSASHKDDGVVICIRVREPRLAPADDYEFTLHARDLDHPQFEWQFQRQFYDALHDYLMEMFIRTPQDLSERRERDA